MVNERTGLVGAKDAYGRPAAAYNGGVVNHGRTCKDILFALLFLGAVIAYIVVTAKGFKEGNPSALVSHSGEIPKTVSEKLRTRLQSKFAHVVGQMRDQWRVILGSAALSVVLAFVWVQLLRVATKAMIYATLLTGIILVTGLSVYMLSLGQARNNKYLIVCGILGLVLAVVLVCVTLGLRSKIALTAAMMKEACSGLNHNPSLLLIAVLSLVLFLGFVAYWLTSFVYLYSVTDESMTHSLYYCVFAFFWISGVIVATAKMSVAGGMAAHYYSRRITAGSSNPVDDSFSPAVASYVRGWTLSLGSLALGALLVAIIKFINWLLNKARKESKSKVIRAVLSCIMCCLGSIQKTFEWVNKFGIVYIAMKGDSFCTATKSVFELLKAEGLSVVAVDFISDWILFVGKLCGSAASTLLALAILHARDESISGLTLTAIIIIAYIVFDIFGHIIGFGVDTMFVCLMEDVAANGSGNVRAPEMHSAIQMHADL